MGKKRMIQVHEAGGVRGSSRAGFDVVPPQSRCVCLDHKSGFVEEENIGRKVEVEVGCREDDATM